MRELGLETLGDLADAPDGKLERVLGSWGPHAARLARGLDERDVVPDGTARSIGAEETYEEDLLTVEAIGATLLDHSIRVARRLLRAELRARTVTVKIKYADFSVRSRSVTLPEAVQDTDAVHRAALECLARVPLQGRRVRLTGVSASGIESGPPAPSLFKDAAAERRRALEQVTARIADRYSDEGAVTRASLVRRPR
jgi:DNA polymerase-4